MKPEYKQLYEVAFDLMKAERASDAIAEFKRILEDNRDPAGICNTMIAMLYYYELDDHTTALPFAERAIQMKPKSENASVCLAHCLFEAGRQEDMKSEIRRYVATGGKIDLYQTLFDENDVTVDDFT